MRHKGEKMHELQMVSDEKREAILKKLSDLEIRKEQMMERKNESIKEIMEKEERNHRKLLRNLNAIEKERNDINNFILEYQVDLVNRAHLKENYSDAMRINA
jgi:hypothetical protein